MPIEKIIKKIKEDTQEKRDNILKRGEEKAQEIEEKIEKEKERKLEEIRKERERDIKTMKNRIISQAKLKTKKRKLNVREDMIEQVFEKAKSRLDSKEPKEYKGYLKHSIKRADELLGRDIRIECDPGSEELVRVLVRDVDTRMEIDPTLKTIGGIKAVSEKGSILDFTFEANLDSKRKELRKEISDILFQKEEED